MGVCFVLAATFLLRPLYLKPGADSDSATQLQESGFAEKAALNQMARIALGAETLAGDSPSVRGMMAPLHESIREGEKEGEHLDLLLMRLSVYEFLGMEGAIRETLARIESVPELDSVASTADPDSSTPSVTRLMSRLYLDKRSLDTPEIERIAGELGFVGRLATIRNLELLASPEVDAAIKDAKEEAARYLIGFVIVVSLILSLLGAGLLLLIASGIRLQAGKMPGYFAPGSLPPWLSLESFTAFLLLMIAGSLLGAQIPRPPSLPLLPSLVLQVLLFIVVLYPRIYGVRTSVIRNEIGLTRGKGIWREIAWGPIAYVAALPLVAVGVLITLFIVRITGENPSQGMHPIVPMIKGPDSTPLTVLMALIIAVVLAPLLEEMTFRGFFYNALRSRFSPLVSIAVSAAFFAGIHPQGIIGFPMLMAIGIVLATLREWRGSLIAPIVTHACTNGATLLIVLLGF